MNLFGNWRFLFILILPLVLSSFLLPPAAIAKQLIRSLEGVVTKVSDGDTVRVEDTHGNSAKVRLFGIDAPETTKVNRKTGLVSKAGQPYGNEAWEALGRKVYRERVRLDVMDIDRYRRLVCVIWLGNRNVNKQMVAEGWASAYRDYLSRPHASEYINLEEDARAKHLGLWQQNHPQPPWEFRALSQKKRSV